MNTNYKFTLERIHKSLKAEESKGKTNKYIQLYKAIKNCIVNIELPHNWALPSTRYLADQLGFSRTTILKSYELLLLEKIIISKQGSGYKVNFENNINKKF